MFKRFVKDSQSLEQQLLQVVKSLGEAIATLEQETKKKDNLELCQHVVKKLKNSHTELGEVVTKVLKHNKELEQTIKAQTAKINSLENEIATFKSQMEKQRTEQEAKNCDFQKQLDDLKSHHEDRKTHVEHRLRTVVTAVIAANRFRETLEGSEVVNTTQ